MEVLTLAILIRIPYPKRQELRYNHAMRLLKSGDPRKKSLKKKRKSFCKKKNDGKISSALFQFCYEAKIPVGALMLLLECIISITKLPTCQQ